ncbi:RNA polymerase sigma factor [Bernardetia sp. ABR2-2B]|uniref:RNA polymerase sigma factor n=1 Tax=Bernardetia sp. ABR2-2B TaxID=3127472 RepID=UPI0030D26ABF
MENPFQLQNYSDQTDNELLDQSIAGNKKALNQLIKRHQIYIYNVAWKMVHDPNDAWDITQEVLVKVITNLSKFKRESNFRTWIYRITFNHFLQTQKTKKEKMVSSFDFFEKTLENAIERESDMNELEQEEYSEYIQEMKLQCMAGMLLCLSREQRLVYILGEVFQADHNLGAELLNVSTGNFRIKLSRAKKDLHNFLNNKCGLVNKNNPCRCRKQTKFALENGILQKGKLSFNLQEEGNFKDFIEPFSNQIENFIDEKYRELYSEQPFKSKFEKQNAIREIIEDKTIQELFEK